MSAVSTAERAGCESGSRKEAPPPAPLVEPRPNQVAVGGSGTAVTACESAAKESTAVACGVPGAPDVEPLGSRRLWSLQRRPVAAPIEGLRGQIKRSMETCGKAFHGQLVSSKTFEVAHLQVKDLRRRTHSHCVASARVVCTR